jgi:hypothetical protein
MMAVVDDAAVSHRAMHLRMQFMEEMAQCLVTERGLPWREARHGALAWWEALFGEGHGNK